MICKLDLFTVVPLDDLLHWLGSWGRIVVAVVTGENRNVQA